MPDWTNYSEHHGGYLRDVPEPRVRIFPHPGIKRAITIRITRYYGVGRHYFASVEERGNPIWDEGVHGWRFCWDDIEKEGRGFHSPRCNSIYWARKWVEEILGKHFPAEQYEYRWQDYTQDEEADGRSDRPRWFYRDGD